MAGLVIELNQADFEQKVESPGLSLVDFWAPWCGPCRMIAPILEDLAKEFQGKLSFYKVNVDVDSNSDLASKFKISAIPTIILFKDGKPVDQVMGAVPIKNFRDMLSKHLG